MPVSELLVSLSHLFKVLVNTLPNLFTPSEPVVHYLYISGRVIQREAWMLIS